MQGRFTTGAPVEGGSASKREIARIHPRILPRFGPVMSGPYKASSITNALPTAYCLLPTAYSLLPTPYCLLPTAYCLLPTPYSLLPTPYCLLPTPYSLLPTPYCLLPTPSCLLPTPYCLLPTPYCLLPEYKNSAGPVKQPVQRRFFCCFVRLREAHSPSSSAYSTLPSAETSLQSSNSS